MQQITILQMANGEPDVSASAATYAEGVPQWGLPTVHTQLLQELRAWIETVPDLRRQPRLALERILEVEGSILMDVSVAGLAEQGYPRKAGHFIASITYRRSQVALTSPWQLLDLG